MAQIKQVGIGRKSSGTIDGITYYTVNGKTYARSTPNMPTSSYNTPEAKIRQAIFKFIQMHMRFHLRTIKQTITPKNGSASNRYYSLNSKALTLALQTLAEQYVDGEEVTITAVEDAISAYAAEHPESIKIASKSGYQEVFLTGAWPETITLNAQAGDSTVIIFVAENGVQTTINPDGTVTTGPREHSDSSTGSNGSNSSSGSNDSNGSGGSNPEPGTVNPEPGNGGGDNSDSNNGGGNTGGGSGQN